MKQAEQRRRTLNNCLNRVMTLKQEQQFREALIELEELQQRHPESVRVWAHLSDVAIQLQDYVRARVAAQRGLTLHTIFAFPQWRVMLLINGAIAAFQLGAYEEAIRGLECALALDPEHPVAHHHLSRALQHTGDLSRALQHSERAVSLASYLTHRDRKALTRQALEDVGRLAAATPDGNSDHVFHEISPETAAALLTTLLRPREVSQA